MIVERLVLRSCLECVFGVSAGLEVLGGARGRGLGFREGCE